MFKKLFSRFVKRRHYWRDIEFDELSELYTSMMFRSLAMSIVGIFIPIYLYTLNYPIWQIFFFYAMIFSVQASICIPAGYLIAKVGPKHTILVSYVFQVIGMLLLVSLPTHQWPLILIAFIMGTCSSLFFPAFHVDFSKIQHRSHGGKELGWMFSMDKIGAVLGPIVGGLIAYFFDAQYIFLGAIVILILGIVPLLLTSEPIATNQKLDFSKLDTKKIKPDLISGAFFNIENIITLIAWPLFVSVYVFKDNPFVQLGAITSASVLLSLFMARAIGRFIDRKKGKQLLRYGVVLNAGLHLFRPFVNGFPSALGINLANEAVTPAYRMPYIKGFYDAAGDIHGGRIVYIVIMESVTGIAKALLFFIAGIIALTMIDPESVFTGIFVVGAIASLGILLERFKALNN